MASKLRPVLTVAALGAVGLLATNGLAYAATGHALILGHKNYANRLTTLHRTTKGPALRLETHSGSAPLSVNQTKKVANLNADLLDGKHASALQTRAIRYNVPTLSTSTKGAYITFPGLKPGIYQVSFNIVARMATADDAVGCFFVFQNTSQIESFGSPYYYYSSASSSGTLDLRKLSTSSPLRFVCSTKTNGNFNFAGNLTNDDSVTFIRIDGLSVKSASSTSP